MTRARTLTSLMLAAGLAGCSTPPATDAAGPEPGTRLTATLTSPTDIRLTWTGSEPRAAGRIVEFATEPRGVYTVLRFVPLRETTFEHPNLIPQTSFYYRLRPFYGPASRPVEVTLPAGSFDRKARENDHEWAYPRALPGGPAKKHQIRNATTAEAAAPTGVKATVMHANGIRFTWTDNAADEEGYLIEVRPAGHTEYGVAAVLDPDITSFGLITLPDEKKATYRVRAFYYGRSSNVVHQTTGPEPSPTIDGR